MLYNNCSTYINFIFLLYQCNKIMYSSNIKSILLSNRYILLSIYINVIFMEFIYIL